MIACRLTVAALQRAHELLVDLDDIERQLRQRREAGMAAAEIVDRQPHAGITSTA